MPWTESPVERRRSFLAECQVGEGTFSDLCDAYEIARKTGYKWVDRFEAGGLAALADRSSAPGRTPHSISPEIEHLLLWYRLEKPYIGPKKIRDELQFLDPTLDLPAVSTVGEVLKRNGLIEPRYRRRRFASTRRVARLVADAPNDVWCADFKGDRLLGNGIRCWPLTLTDAWSRYLVMCRALRSTEGDPVQQAFTAAFRENGLPTAIRTDNGVPFAHPNSLQGLSSLAIWWIRLGVRPQRIEPAKPQQNGRHERMHGTLERRRDLWPKANMAAQQEAFDRFVDEFNHERPHEALGMAVPAERYEPSRREFPEVLPEVEYDLGTEVRRVDSNGCIKWRSWQVFLTSTLGGQDVGLVQQDERRWVLWFSDYPLAMVDICTGQLAELPHEERRPTTLALGARVKDRQGPPALAALAPAGRTAPS